MNEPVTLIALAAMAWRAEWLFRQMQALPKALHSGPLPSLSIIVPARNEAENLRRLLPSLTSIRYPGSYEVIVVDDNSTDETAAVAAAHGVRVLRLVDLPSGWVGKTHAAHQGALASSGEWLLFTDADTVHTVNGPACTVAHAARAGLDGLSLFLRHECNTWLERPALMAAYAGLYAGLARQANLLNGQYILLRRDVYEQSGGMAAVRGEPLEDLALGQRLRRQGFQVPLLRGEAAAQVWMYRNTRELWAGLTRLSVATLPWSGKGALVTALFTVIAAAPLTRLLKALVRRRGRRQAALAWSLTAVALWPWGQRFGSGWWALPAPVGAFLVQAAGIWGLLNRLSGRGLRWKDRTI